MSMNPKTFALPVKTVSKGQLLELFKISEPEYVDLMRDRPKKDEPYKYPFFRPLKIQNRLGRGRGGQLEFMFVDFILLEIMLNLKVHSFPRDCGVFLRRMFVTIFNIKINIKVSDYILSTDFDYKKKWILKIQCDSSANQKLSIALDENEVAMCFATRTEQGLRMPEPLKKSEEFKLNESIICLEIDLNKVHQKVLKLYSLI